jgi:hypothetical protein
MGPVNVVKFDPINRMSPLIVIPLSGAHCNWNNYKIVTLNIYYAYFLIVISNHLKNDLAIVFFNILRNEKSFKWEFLNL